MDKLGDGGLLARHIALYFPEHIKQAALDNLRLLMGLAYMQGAHDTIAGVDPVAATQAGFVDLVKRYKHG